MKKFAKYLALLLAMLMAFSLMAACGGDKEEEKPADEGEKDTSGGVQSKNKPNNAVVIATANEPPTMAPHQHNAVAGGYMNILTHNSMFKTNIDTLAPEPGLIESYEIASDTEWILHVREGVKFHDGSALDAADIVASMEYAKEQSAYTSTFTTFWKSVEAVDEMTVKVVTNEVYSKTLYDLASHYILPSELIAQGTRLLLRTPSAQVPTSSLSGTSVTRSSS